MVNRDSAFKDELLRLYELGTEHNYIYVMQPFEVEELLKVYEEEFISASRAEKLEYKEIVKMMMIQMTSVYRLDPPEIGREAENLVLISNVQYDGEKIYIKFKKISPLKMKRFQEGISKKELSRRTGLTMEAIDRCESDKCDLRRQAESIVGKFADVLNCDVEDLFWKE